MKPQLYSKLILNIRSLFSILLVFFTLNSYAQFEVFLSFEQEDKEDTLYNRVVEELMQRNTYFLIKPDFEEHIDQLQHAANQFWKLGTLKVIQYEAYEQYLKNNPNEIHGLIDITGIITDVTMNTRTGGGYTTAHYFLEYRLIAMVIPQEEAYTKRALKGYKKKGEKPPVVREEFYIAKHELYPGQEIISELIGRVKSKVRISFTGANSFDEDEHLQFVLTEGRFYNYELGFLINYLKLYNNYLLEKTEKGYFAAVEKKSLSALKKNTLYIPEFTLEKYNRRKGFQGEKFVAGELLEDYDYPYEIISIEALNDKILNAKEDFYYYTFIRGTTDAYHVITNGKTGEILYNRYDPLTYNIKSKDFLDISRRVK